MGQPVARLHDDLVVEVGGGDDDDMGRPVARLLDDPVLFRLEEEKMML